MVGFIDNHRETFGVEPICAVLPIAPSRYCELRARDRDPDRKPGRVRRDEAARATVACLMRRLGLAGAVRGQKFTATTIPDTAAARRIWRRGSLRLCGRTSRGSPT
jgi:hypothetical protein